MDARATSLLNGMLHFNNDQFDVVHEEFLLSTNTPVALSYLAAKHAMEQSAVRQSDNMGQRSWQWRSMDLIDGIPTLDVISR